MTWRIAVTTGHFLPVDPENPVLNRIDAPDEEIDNVRAAEEQRQSSATYSIDPDTHVHMLAIPNEGMMAGQPTNCYLIGAISGDNPLTLVDAGRKEGYDIFVGAFEEAGVEPARIRRIVLTHCHPDHVGGAQRLKELTGAEVYAPPLERQQIERFAPDLEVDHWLDHEAPLDCDGFTLTPIFTPGHAPGHIAFVESETNMLIAGDMISGFGSVGIFPPNGSVADYLASLRRLLDWHEREPFTAVLPGHGPVIADAKAKIEEYIQHRLDRERQIIAALEAHGPLSPDDLMPIIYVDILPHLAMAGKSTITMHLQKLVEEGRASEEDGVYRLVG